MSFPIACITGIVRSERKMPPMPRVSPIVWRRPWRAGISKSISVAAWPPTWIMLIAWSQPSSARRRSACASIVAPAPSASFVQRAIASAASSRSGSMSCRAMVASASSGKLRMSPSRFLVNSTLPAPMKAIRVTARSVPQRGAEWLVHARIVGHPGEQRELVAHPLEHLRPEAVGVGREHVVGQRGGRDPCLLLELALQLPRPPSGVAGEGADADHLLGQLLWGRAELDGGDGAADHVQAVGLTVVSQRDHAAR